MKILEKSDKFEDLVKEGITLVDFYAEWCGPCKMMGPVLESLKNINIIKVNVDEFGELSEQFRIMSIPTLVFFKNGEKVNEAVGFHSKEQIESIIKEL